MPGRRGSPSACHPEDRSDDADMSPLDSWPPPPAAEGLPQDGVDDPGVEKIGTVLRDGEAPDLGPDKFPPLSALVSSVPPEMASRQGSSGQSTPSRSGSSSLGSSPNDRPCTAGPFAEALRDQRQGQKPRSEKERLRDADGPVVVPHATANLQAVSTPAQSDGGGRGTRTVVRVCPLTRYELDHDRERRVEVQANAPYDPHPHFLTHFDRRWVCTSCGAPVVFHFDCVRTFEELDADRQRRLRVHDAIFAPLAATPRNNLGDSPADEVFSSRHTGAAEGCGIGNWTQIPVPSSDASVCVRQSRAQRRGTHPSSLKCSTSVRHSAAATGRSWAQLLSSPALLPVPETGEMLVSHPRSEQNHDEDEGQSSTDSASSSPNPANSGQPPPYLEAFHDECFLLDPRFLVHVEGAPRRRWVCSVEGCGEPIEMHRRDPTRHDAQGLLLRPPEGSRLAVLARFVGRVNGVSPRGPRSTSGTPAPPNSSHLSTPTVVPVTSPAPVPAMGASLESAGAPLASSYGNSLLEVPVHTPPGAGLPQAVQAARQAMGPWAETCAVCGYPDRRPWERYPRWKVTRQGHPHGPPVSMAHVLSPDALQAVGYVDDETNYVPLCGTLGWRGCCHDAFDNNLLLFAYEGSPRNDGRFVVWASDPSYRHLSGLHVQLANRPHRSALHARARHSLMSHQVADAPPSVIEAIVSMWRAPPSSALRLANQNHRSSPKLNAGEAPQSTAAPSSGAPTAVPSSTDQHPTSSDEMLLRLST